MKYSIALLCAALLYAALALTGCSDALAPTVPHKSGLYITVSSDQVNPRTLFPTTTDFTKYMLSFESANGIDNHADEVLEGGATTATVTGLAAGSWTVTVTGWVTVDGTECPVAWGSGQVVVSSGTFQSLDVTIRASMETEKGNGFFSYAVSLPPTKVMETAVLQISSFSYNLFDDPSGTIELPPGQYTMTVQLDNGYQTVGHTEIVYICSNLETEANYTFTDDDFADTITISGEIDVKVNGGTPLNARLYAYLDVNYSYSLEYVDISMTDGTWSMRLAASDTEIPLYFKVVTFYNGLELSKEIGNKGVTVEDQSGIDLGTVNFSTVTLSGTINVTCGGDPVSEVSIAMVRYGEEIRSISLYSPGAAASWSITVPSFTTPADITFRVRGYSFGTSIFTKYIENLASNVTDQNITGIAINLGDINSFTSATPLSPNTWVNGNITVNYAIDWYSINVNAGITYYFWWNDSLSGDKNQSLDIDVYVFDSNGNQIFSGDDMGYDAREFTATTSTVYIRVNRHGGGDGTGTYQIVYSTVNSRPDGW